jgi:hypothetical protein
MHSAVAAQDMGDGFHIIQRLLGAFTHNIIMDGIVYILSCGFLSFIILAACENFFWLEKHMVMLFIIKSCIL